ncbi:PAS domain-containing protein [Ancylomarina sp. 16SWW S1-10-2]|uniref:PAS domain-containing protein n=1 Tax=Ancylomarina sp. 16SWW S1-10-2 TaxID=2499681 RepID=UPI0012AD8DF9|nr:PAS domain-containing protein [Ancylomarina sp. 16SWW S1-10-2]MRT94300.1 PAS domain S-box protein [Ancylomarina sp. 16SWW S1-10-2]
MKKTELNSICRSNFRSPILFILAFTFALSGLLIILHNNSINKQTYANELLADRYSKNIESNLKGNIDFLNLLAIELSENNLSESVFQEKVNNYLKNHPEFINITWVDSNFTIKSVCPLEENSHIIGLNIELPIPKETSRLAQKEKKAIYTQAFDAIQGESSFEVWIPAFNENKFRGLFAAVYSSKNVINTWIDIEKYSNTCFSLLNNEDVIIAESSKKKFDTNVIYAQKSLSSLNNGMKLQVKSEITSPFSPPIIITIIFLFILIFGIAYTLLRLKNTQFSLKKNELILLKQNKDLINTKKNLRNTFDISPSIICKANINTGYFVEANKAVNKILGYSNKEFTSKPFIDFVHPDDRQKTIDEALDQMKGKKTSSFENRYLCKNGLYKWIAWHGTKADENGISTAVGSDIHVRKLAEQELTKHRENLEELVKERTKELETKNKELERFNNLFVDREFKINDLKNEINKLKNR